MSLHPDVIEAAATGVSPNDNESAATARRVLRALAQHVSDGMVKAAMRPVEAGCDITPKEMLVAIAAALNHVAGRGSDD